MMLSDDQAHALRQQVMRFQELCVQKGVIADRTDGRRPLGRKNQEALAAGRLVDPRAPRLATISGKGGWHGDPAIAAKRACLRNVSLLDHALSVGRGGAVIAVLTAVGDNPAIETAAVGRITSLGLALGLLHDVDKDLGLARNVELKPDQVAERVTRYCLDTFLREVDVEFSAEQLRTLIAVVEDSQAGRYRTRVPGWADAVARAVRLADKLDGAFLEGTPADGAAAVLERLDKVRQQFPALSSFKVLRLRDPHHLFLLEELLQRISAACERVTGLRPLIEICADGELVALLPKQAHDDIVDLALERLTGSLRRRLFCFSIGVTTRQSARLMGARPDLETFCRTCAEDVANLGSFLFVSKAGLQVFLEVVEPYLQRVGLPLAPGSAPGQTVPILPSLDDLSAANMTLLGRALTARVLLGVTDAQARKAVKALEGSLLALLPTTDEPFDGLGKAEDRALALALLAAAGCEDAGICAAFDAAISTALGACTSGMPDVGDRILDEVRTRFARLLKRQALATASGERHCLFTNEPVPEWMPAIEEADKLHGVKVTAFSGRSGRPESLTMAKGETAVSPTSFVERKLQAWLHERPGRDAIPLLVTSPSSIGLFAALSFQNDNLQTISTYELLVQDPKKQHVTIEAAFERRYLLARFESMPTSLVEQIGLIDRLIRISLKLGRPLHVFSGLPEPRPEIFYMDAMPPVLANLIGGHGLRLEQMQDALHRIGQALILTDKKRGLGPDLLKLFARESTRLRAAAFAARQLRLREQGSEALAFEAIVNDCLEGAFPVAEPDKPLIRLGELAARVQRTPQGTASRNDEALVFRTCLKTAAGLNRKGMSSAEEIALGIAGVLDGELGENRKAAGIQARGGEQKLYDALEELGRFFAEQVWAGVCKGRPPTNADRRLMEAVYVAAVTRAWRLSAATRRAASGTVQED